MLTYLLYTIINKIKNDDEALEISNRINGVRLYCKAFDTNDGSTSITFKPPMIFKQAFYLFGNFSNQAAIGLFYIQGEQKTASSSLIINGNISTLDITVNKTTNYVTISVPQWGKYRIYSYEPI